MVCSLRLAAYALASLAGFASPALSEPEPPTDHSYIVFQDEENQFAKDWMTKVFRAYTTYLSGYPVYKGYIDRIDLRIDVASDYSVYTTFQNDRYSIRVSTGLYRLLMNLAIWQLSDRRDASVVTIQCIRDYFTNSSRFLKPIKGYPPNALMPRIDKFLLAKCEQASKTLRPIAEKGISFLESEMIAAAAFILLHEIGHVILGHFHTKFESQQELDADGFATIHSMYQLKGDFNGILGRQLTYFTFVPSSGHSFLGNELNSISAGQRFAQIMSGCLQYTNRMKDNALRARIEKSYEGFFVSVSKTFNIPLPKR